MPANINSTCAIKNLIKQDEQNTQVLVIPDEYS